MPSPTFYQLFGLLTAASLATSDVARLREWIASIAHPGACIALIEQAAAGRPCPHCGCPRKHRCGQASGLQRPFQACPRLLTKKCRCRESEQRQNSQPITEVETQRRRETT